MLSFFSTVIFFGPYLYFNSYLNNAGDSDGQLGMETFGLAVYQAAFLVVSIK